MITSAYVPLVSHALAVGGTKMYDVQLARSIVDRSDRVTSSYGEYFQNLLLERPELPLRAAESSTFRQAGSLLVSGPRPVHFCVAERVTIVHTVLPTIGPAAWLAARDGTVRRQRTDAYRGQSAHRLYRCTTRKMLDRHVALSDYIADERVRAMGVRESDGTHVPTRGVTDRFRPCRATGIRSILPGVVAGRGMGVHPIRARRMRNARSGPPLLSAAQLMPRAHSSAPGCNAPV
jgi:hypothetical protein